MANTILTHQYADGHPKVTVEIDIDAPFSELLDMFAKFAQAIGYTNYTVTESMRNYVECVDEGYL